MIDWLTKNYDDPSIEVAGHVLPIAIKRHATAKRLVMRLAPDGSEVRVTMPRWGRTAEVMDFVHSRRDWLANQVSGLSVPNPVGPGSAIPFCGHNLQIHWDPAAPRKAELDGDHLRLGGPEASVAKRVERWLREQALTAMERDLRHYCSAANQTVPDLKLSSAKRRWGSCSSTGTVRMNWRLIMAPENVRKSVVAHEVAHLVHFDHSPDFHALLDAIFDGNLRAANTWLKTDGRSLYQPFG